MSRLTRDGTVEPISRDQIIRRERGQGYIYFPRQLTTSRIVNLTRLIHTLAICVTINTCDTGSIFLPICSKKNMNASRPSEHTPVRGENVKMFRRNLHRWTLCYLWNPCIVPVHVPYLSCARAVLLTLWVPC